MDAFFGFGTNILMCLFTFYYAFMHGESVGIGGGLGVAPGVALAYAVVAVGFFAVEKFGASTETMSSLPEIPLAAPAE
jgi:AGZA family xanthine/uracil permease-like MFS transporter